MKLFITFIKPVQESNNSNTKTRDSFGTAGGGKGGAALDETMLNQSLLNDSSIVNDDVDFQLSGLEPLQEEEEDGDVDDDVTRNQTTTGFSYQPTEGLTTSVIPSMANLVEEDEKEDDDDEEEGRDKNVGAGGRGDEGTTTALITEAVPSMSRLLDEDEEHDKENISATENRSVDANVSAEQVVQEDEITLGSVLNVTVNNNQSIASQYTSGGTEKLNVTNSVDDSMMQNNNNNNKQQPITPSFTFGFDSSLDPDLVDKDGSSREHATITPATATTTATRMNTTTRLNNTTTNNNTTTINTGTMNVTMGYDDEDFDEIDLRAKANKEMGTETYEFLYGAGANATRRLTGTQPLNSTNTLSSSAQETPSMTLGGNVANANTTQLQTPFDAPSSNAKSEHDGFTPGESTLRMAEALRKQQHGQEALQTMRMNYQVDGNDTNMHSVTVTKDDIFRRQSQMYNTPGARYNRNRRSSALMLLDRSELHGHYTPTFDNDKARNFGTPARKGALKGLPVELPPIPDALLAKDAKPLELSDLYHACQVSFVPAENMRRSSIAFGQLATLPPPETCEDGLKIVCLVNPLIEALESFHEDLGEKMHSLSAEVEKLRSEVEIAQPMFLRLASSDDPQHKREVSRAGQALKKKCKMEANERFDRRKLNAETTVNEALRAHEKIAQNSKESVHQSRERLVELRHIAERKLELLRKKRSEQMLAIENAKKPDATRTDVMNAVLDSRAALQAANNLDIKLETTVAEKQAKQVALPNEVESLKERVEEMRIAVQNDPTLENNQELTMNLTRMITASSMKALGNGNSRFSIAANNAQTPGKMRLASRVRLSQKAKKAESLADDYSIIASLAPFSLERVDGAESAELTLRVGELFLVTLDARTGAGRCTLVQSSSDNNINSDSPLGIENVKKFAAAVAGAPFAWNIGDQSSSKIIIPGAGCSGVLQNICPRLRAAEAIVKECEKCRDAFTSISNIVLEEDGKISLTFSDVRRGRILDVSLDMRLTIEDADASNDSIGSRDDVKCAFGFGTSKENTERSLRRALRRSNASVFGAKKLFSTCKLVDAVVRGGVDATNAAFAVPDLPASKKMSSGNSAPLNTAMVR